MKKTKFIMFVALLAGGGCLSSEQITQNCGPRPTITQAEWGVDYYVQNSGLLDPGSAQIKNIRIVEPCGQPNIHGNIYGWLVTFELNAKNAFGGYVGFRTKQIIMRNGGTGVWFNPYQP